MATTTTITVDANLEARLAELARQAAVIVEPRRESREWLVLSRASC